MQNFQKECETTGHYLDAGVAERKMKEIKKALADHKKKELKLQQKEEVNKRKIILIFIFFLIKYN